MRCLLIDNTKNSKDEFTNILHYKLLQLLGESGVIRCSNATDVVSEINRGNLQAAILSGSSLNLSEPNRIELVRKSITSLLRLKIPILGICFGMQLICTVYGGAVERMVQPVKGEETIFVSEDSVLLGGGTSNLKVTLSHGDRVTEVPQDFKTFSRSSSGATMIVECIKYNRFGVQFHPEKLPDGEETCVISNFLKYSNEINTLPMELSSHATFYWKIICLINHNMSWASLDVHLRDVGITRDVALALWRHHIHKRKIRARLL